MNQFVRCVVILMLLVSTASVATAQCYTYCVVDNVIVGCCPQDYPTCCIVSGVFACCRFNNNNGTSMSFWRTRMNQSIKIDYVERLNIAREPVMENP
jgi:hypothetical protein